MQCETNGSTGLGVRRTAGVFGHECGVEGVDVFEQVFVDVLPKRVQDEFHAFSAGELGGGHKVAVSRHQDDGLSLLFEGDAGDVNGDAHIDPFLAQTQCDVVGLDGLPKVVSPNELAGLIDGYGQLKVVSVGQGFCLHLIQAGFDRAERGKLKPGLEDGFAKLGQGHPVVLTIDFAQSQCELALLSQALKEGFAVLRQLRFGEVDQRVGDGVMRFA